MAKNSGEICLSVSLSGQQAWDLAQFLKRTGFADFRSHAVDDEEACRMQNVAGKVRQSLKQLGYAPR
jgi:hypothetical protein